MGCPHKSHWIADTKMLAKALRSIEESTKNCSENDLRELYKSGLLPTGILDFLLKIRV